MTGLGVITSLRPVFNCQSGLLHTELEVRDRNPALYFTVPRSATGRLGFPPGAFFMGIE